MTSYTVVVDPVNTKHPYNIYTTPAQRLRRWISIAPMPHECSVPTGKCIKSYTRIILEKHRTMIQCQANEGPTLKAVCHLCGSIGPMSSVSRYLLWQCGYIPYNDPCKPGSQQTRDAETMLGRYWPASTQHRINVSCLPGCQIQLEYHDKNWQY